MKALEQLIIQTRSRLRARRALSFGEGRPSRLTLRLDDLDAPGPIPAATSSATRWHEHVIRFVEWEGALPTEVVGRAEHALLCDLVRFAHRLECPTTLRTSAKGLAPRAEELVDAGLDVAIIRVAGSSDAVQGAVLGETVDDARDAIEALLRARGSRSSRLDVLVEVPVDPRGLPELRELVAFTKALGVDGLRLAAPWRGGPWDDASRAALAWAAEQKGRFHQTPPEVFEALARMAGDGPGAPRQGGRCPVGALRVELLPDGSVRSCPFLGAAVPVGERLEDAWKALEETRGAIRRCERHCAHPELVR